MSESSIVLTWLVVIVIVGLLGANFGKNFRNFMDRSYKDGNLISISTHFKDKSGIMLQCKGTCLKLEPVIRQADWSYALNIEVSYVVNGKRYLTDVSPYEPRYSYTENLEAFNILEKFIKENSNIYVFYNQHDPADAFAICRNFFSWRDVECYERNIKRS